VIREPVGRQRAFGEFDVSDEVAPQWWPFGALMDRRLSGAGDDDDAAGTLPHQARRAAEGRIHDPHLVRGSAKPPGVRTR